MDIVQKALGKFWKTVEKADQKRMSGLTLPGGIHEWIDLPYMNDDNVMHLLDVYRPAEAKGCLPVIIDIHGGGWMYGNKELNKNYCMNLATLGFVVFNINYRLVPEIAVDGQLRDVSSAIKWIGENCEDYNGDSKNVFLTGDSAGGHLALLTALLNTSENERKLFSLKETSIKFSAVGLTSPAVDLLSSATLRRMLPTVLGRGYKTSPFYKYMDITGVYNNHNLPPVFVVTSGGDALRNQSRRLRKFFIDNKLEFFYHDWHGDECTRSLPHVFPVLHPEWEESRIATYEMVSYFRRFIK